MGMIPPIGIAMVGYFVSAASARNAMGGALIVSGWLAVAIGLMAVFSLLWHLFRPRIAYSDGHVLFYLRYGGPIAVPIEVVEAFFLGQGPADLPAGRAPEAESTNLIARIAERAQEWKAVDVKPVFGTWCDGYVTLRGAWVEPLTEDLVRRINHQLAVAKRELAGR